MYNRQNKNTIQKASPATVQYYRAENKFKIYDGDYTEYTTATALNQLPRNTGLTITKGDSLYKYKVTQPGEFTFER